MGLSKAAVLTHLARWEDHRDPVVAAVAEGIGTRIDAGEMDEQEEERP